MKKRIDFSNWWSWQAGRQGTGYEKMLLLTGTWPLPFDVYLVRYKPGQGIPPHRDASPLEGYGHYRANAVIQKGKEGGEFVCEAPLFQSARLNVFCSNRSLHEVKPVISGVRYVLSLGWLKKEKVRP